MKLSSRKGFTLIELIVVMVIIGILAAVAIPKFADMQTKAKFSSLRGTLGNVRSAISIAKANNLVSNSNSAISYWPYLTQVQAATQASTVTTPGCPLDSVLPNEPFLNVNTVKDASIADANARTVSGAQGWAYCEELGIFYANTSTTNPDDGGAAANNY